MPLNDLIKQIFSTKVSYSLRKGYVEPVMPSTDYELKMLEYIYNSPIIISLQKDEFIMDLHRFRRILKGLGIIGCKSSLNYLNAVKMNGNRISIQEKTTSLYLNGEDAVDDSTKIWKRTFDSLASIIEGAGLGKFGIEEFTTAGIVYDMVIIFYVATLSFIVGYISVIDYKRYTTYVMNICHGIFVSRNSFYKSYLVGKGLSKVNGHDFEKSVLVIAGVLCGTK